MHVQYFNNRKTVPKAFFSTCTLVTAPTYLTDKQVMLRVFDLEKSIQYYTQALGMTLLRKRCRHDPATHEAVTQRHNITGAGMTLLHMRNFSAKGRHNVAFQQYSAPNQVANQMTF
eukprot:scaffold27878_cov19-Tisochrysis_lutea.AAC.1